MKRIFLRGYRRAEHQEFGTFEQGDQLLGEQCARCKRHSSDYNKTCRTNAELRSAMGENYPMWSKYFVRLTPSNYDFSLKDKFLCRRFLPLAKAERPANQQT